MTRAPKLHMTLAFLGDVARPRIRELTALAAQFEGDAFELQLDLTGGWRRQGIVWIAPQVVPAALNSLVSALHQSLRTAEFTLEKRAWRAHVTLLRDVQTMTDFSRPALQWRVHDIALVESLNGAYRTIERWPLRAPGPVR